MSGDYYDNSDFTNLQLTRIDPTVDFDWGGGSPDPGIGADTFSVRWTGQVVPLYSQTYTFYTQSDDGVRLWVNGVQVVNNWTDHGSTENSGTIALTAGREVQRHDGVLRERRAGGGEVVMVQREPGEADHPVGAALLSARVLLAHELADAHQHANEHGHAYANINPDVHANPHTDADEDAHEHEHADADLHEDADQYADAGRDLRRSQRRLLRQHRPDEPEADAH